MCLMEALRDGFLFNSMLKHHADISKLPKTLYGKQIHRVRMYVTPYNILCCTSAAAKAWRW